MRLFIFSFFFVIIFISCTSYPGYDRSRSLPESNPLAVTDEIDAQVIVSRLDNDGGYVGIFINGNYAGKLGNGETGFFKLTTGGIHKITARYDIDREIRYETNGNYRVWYGVLTSAIEFSDFGIFNVKYVGYIDKGWNRTGDFYTYINEYYVELTPGDNAISRTSFHRSTFNQAINETFRIISRTIPNNARIAIVNVAFTNMNESLYYIDELTVSFVNAGHFVVDRLRLQTIMDEQRFQMSGYVDDNTIVSIGYFAGANVVLTGNINVIDSQRRLVFRALDVLTGQILAMSSVDL